LVLVAFSGGEGGDDGGRSGGGRGSGSGEGGGSGQTDASWWQREEETVKTCFAQGQSRALACRPFAPTEHKILLTQQ
jgi:hypothetical protein